MPKEEKIAIQKESPSKEKSDLWYQYLLQGKISLPKHTHLPTSQYNDSRDSFENQSWLWSWTVAILL